MLNNRESFRENCDIALNEVLSNLHDVFREFGPSDLPHDKGVALRNALYSFALQFFQSVDYYCYEDPADPWTVTNGEAVTYAAPAALIRLAGSSCYYSHCLNFARRWSGQPVEASPSGVTKNFRILCDWVTNMYGFEPSVPQGWFRMTVTSSNLDEFDTAATSLLAEEARMLLGIKSADIGETWTAMAVVVDLASAGIDDAEVAARADAVFALFDAEEEQDPIDEDKATPSVSEGAASDIEKAFEFVLKRRKVLPGQVVTDEELRWLNESEIQETIGVALDMLKAEAAALTDILANCTNPFQFAKTYKVLRADFRRTFGPRIPADIPEKNKVLLVAGERIVKWKLDSMAIWFYSQWGDTRISPLEYHKAIEQYTNSGCFGALLLLVISCAGSVVAAATLL